MLSALECMADVPEPFKAQPSAVGGCRTAPATNAGAESSGYVTPEEPHPVALGWTFQNGTGQVCNQVWIFAANSVICDAEKIQKLAEMRSRGLTCSVE
mmetsp:Transcript_138235/g.275565  ORF Transcript_138235/g.275565 Transcript_138235/m.275565 type:complete len:98 (-) Transcript_138235:2579-2872(-)